MLQSQQRLLDRLRLIPIEERTQEDISDLEELEEIENQEVEDQKEIPEEKTETNINDKLEEILKCLKVNEIVKTPEEVEIPTPPTVLTNQELDQDQEQGDQPIQENKLKQMLKRIW